MSNGLNAKPEREQKVEVEDIFDLERKEPQVPETKEQPSVPEITKEAVPEIKPEVEKELETEDEAARRKAGPPPLAVKEKPEPIAKSETLVQIENVLAEHLDDLFGQMTPQQQIMFKQKGEETASKIEKLVQEMKVKVKEIFDLIKGWLKLIPGVNKFFIEQEAKIKTDRVLALRERQKQK